MSDIHSICASDDSNSSDDDETTVSSRNDRLAKGIVVDDDDDDECRNKTMPDIDDNEVEDRIVVEIEEEQEVVVVLPAQVISEDVLDDDSVDQHNSSSLDISTHIPSLGQRDTILAKEKTHNDGYHSTKNSSHKSSILRSPFLSTKNLQQADVETEQRDDDDLRNDLLLENEDEDDDSIYQGLSLDLNEPWERSLLRSVLNINNGVVYHGNSQSSASCSHTRCGVDPKDPSCSSGTRGIVPGWSNSPNHKSSKKVLLAHTESRDYAYDAAGLDEELLRLDTSTSSDVILPSTSSYSRMLLQQSHHYHLQRQYIHRNALYFRDSTRLAPSESTSHLYNNPIHNPNNENLQENYDSDDDRDAHARRRNDNRIHDRAMDQTPNLVSFGATSDRSSSFMQSFDTQRTSHSNHSNNNTGNHAGRSGVLQYNLPNHFLHPSQPLSVGSLPYLLRDRFLTQPSSSFSSYAPLQQSGAFDEDHVMDLGFALSSSSLLSMSSASSSSFDCVGVSG